MKTALVKIKLLEILLNNPDKAYSLPKPENARFITLHSCILFPSGFSWKELLVCYVGSTTPWSLSPSCSLCCSPHFWSPEKLGMPRVLKISRHAAAAISQTDSFPFGYNKCERTPKNPKNSSKFCSLTCQCFDWQKLSNFQ